MVTTGSILSLENLLLGTCEALQISSTMQKDAEDYYNEVAVYLGEDPILRPVNISSYPQGSLRMGVTVRPYKRNQFDLDFVFELALNNEEHEAKWVLGLMEDRLKQHPEYAEILDTTNNTCSRLRHSDNFHTDIVPGLSTQTYSTQIMVPHRKKNIYLISNPEGLAKWFDLQTIEKVENVYKAYLMDAAPITPLPEKETVLSKPPLKKAVQLLKRNRDIRFYDLPKREVPASVLICVLAAENYCGETSVYDAVKTILMGILTRLDDYKINGVPNPVNPEEDLARAWKEDSKAFQYFQDWLADFGSNWNALSTAKDTKETTQILERLFGETPKEVLAQILKDYSTIDLAVEKSTGYIKPAAMVTGPSIGIKAHNFYGS